MAMFSGFYERHGPTPLGDARSIVPTHRHGHQNGQQSGQILHRCIVFCRPGSHQDNTEQVVARWRHLVALMEALDLLHRMMHTVSHHHTTIAIEMASNGGTSFVVVASFV